MNVILTGMPRSGTTLCCSLLNKLPDCIALAEPMDPTQVDNRSDSGFLKDVEEFFLSQRRSLFLEQTALSKANVEGIIPDNTFEPVRADGALRLCLASTQRVTFSSSPKANFRLVIKHPAFFTVKLSVLIQSYPCFAVIRNPLALLLSWNSVDANISQGRLPMGERFDDNLREALDNEPDRLRRQLKILSYFFDMYETVLPPENVLRYEELIASSGKSLKVIDPNAESLNETFELKNTNPLYDSSSVQCFAEQLLAHDGCWRNFYNDDSIRELCNQWLSKDLRLGTAG